MSMVSETMLAAYFSGTITIGLFVYRALVKPRLGDVDANTNFREWFTGESVQGGDGQLARLDERFSGIEMELENITEENARQREERIEDLGRPYPARPDGSDGPFDPETVDAPNQE